MKESLSLCERDLVSGSLAMATVPMVIYNTKSMTSDLPIDPKSDPSDTPKIFISPASESGEREDVKKS